MSPKGPILNLVVVRVSCVTLENYKPLCAKLLLVDSNSNHLEVESG